MNKSLMAGVRIIIAGLMLIAAVQADAQAPKKFNYQAVVRNSSGVVVGNQRVSMRFSLRNGGVAGGIVYQEVDTGTTNQFGLIVVVIGGGNVIHGNMDTIDWSFGDYYLQIETDITGGTNYLNMGTTQLLSVPFALYARSAGVMALAWDTVPTITGNTNITVTPATSYVSIGSSVTPVSAVVTLSNGTINGHCIILMGSSTAPNGVTIQNGGNVNFGAMTPSIEILNGTMLMLMWNGSQWIKMSYSANQ